MNSVNGPKSFDPCTMRSGWPFFSFTSARVILSSMPAIDSLGTISAEAAPAHMSITRQAAASGMQRVRTRLFYNWEVRSASLHPIECMTPIFKHALRARPRAWESPTGARPAGDLIMRDRTRWRASPIALFGGNWLKHRALDVFLR